MCVLDLDAQAQTAAAPYVSVRAKPLRSTLILQRMDLSSGEPVYDGPLNVIVPQFQSEKRRKEQSPVLLSLAQEDVLVFPQLWGGGGEGENPGRRRERRQRHAQLTAQRCLVGEVSLCARRPRINAVCFVTWNCAQLSPTPPPFSSLHQECKSFGPDLMSFNSLMDFLLLEKFPYPSCAYPVQAYA